jgi:hypothetical protein
VSQITFYHGTPRAPRFQSSHLRDVRRLQRRCIANDRIATRRRIAAAQREGVSLRSWHIVDIAEHERKHVRQPNTAKRKCIVGPHLICIRPLPPREGPTNGKPTESSVKCLLINDRIADLAVNLIPSPVPTPI